jgi:hypothetical protein
VSRAHPTVVVLHGLARTAVSVSGLRRHLERAGFATWAPTYPSRSATIAELSDELVERIRGDLDGELAAVTHSLGGLLVRHMARRLPWRGVVMLAPPNHGSRLALAFRDHPLYRWFYGPAGGELAAPPLPDGWPAPPRPFAVIAGTRGTSPANPARWLKRARAALPSEVPSDGTVAVEETRLEGMADFATVDATHTWIVNHPEARRLVVRFLEKGRFGA